MITVRIEHPITGFEQWKAAFDRDPVDRRGSGVRRYQHPPSGRRPRIRDDRPRLRHHRGGKRFPRPDAAGLGVTAGGAGAGRYAADQDRRGRRVGR